MTHQYILEGMTCTSCEAKVKSALLKIGSVHSVEVSKEENSVTITSEKYLSPEELQSHLDAKYRISTDEHTTTPAPTLSWIETYKPVLLIFMYITFITVIVQLAQGQFNFMEWMGHFMAGFFLVFSFFKMLNLKGFAESYRMYDIVAARIPVWGYIYAYLELSLGIAYLINFNPLLTNAVTFVVMTVSIIGVLQSVFNKKKIQCACLGTVFNLPMSTITIIEDLLMIAMSGWMLVNMI